MRLKNGDLLRGKIAELIPGEAVVIVLISGDKRRIPMSEVAYAGPAAAPAAPPAETGAPPGPTPAGSTGAPATAVKHPDTSPSTRLVSPEPLVVFTRTATNKDWQMLCKTPCERQLLPGYYEFGVSEDQTDEPRNAGGATLTGRATVEAKYRSRSGLRSAGVTTLLLGTFVGIVLWVTASGEEDQCGGTGGCTKVDTTKPFQVWMGRVVTVSSVITGIVLLAIPERASVKVIPTATTSLPPLKSTNAVADKNAIGALPGLSIVGAF